MPLRPTSGGAVAWTDPVVSASVYCAGELDRVISDLVRPAWRRLESEFPGAGAYLWLMRYARGGEHLKVRLHGPAAAGDRFRAAVEELAPPFLAAVREERGEAEDRAARDDAPPIDVEDDDAPPPDPGLRWTTYRRSFVPFGGEPFLSQDEFLARFTRCLGTGTAALLHELERPSGHAFTRPFRRTFLLRLLIATLRGIELPVESWADYLRYHRDWLIRFKVRRAPEGPAKAHRLLARFEQRAVESVEGLAEIRALVAAPADPGLEGWQRDVVRLQRHVRRFSGRPEYRLEPFAPDPAYSPLFKLHHGLTNVTGLELLDESLTHHLLLRAIATPTPGRPEAVQLVPAAAAGGAG